MKTLSTLLVACLICLAFPLQGQVPTNLLGNGDFEVIVGQPDGWGRLDRSFNWHNCNGQHTAFPYGTPDFFTSGGSGGSQWPNTFAGTIVPQSGNALAGFITSNFFVPNFREYASYRMEAPMTPGQTYAISFWLSNGTGNWYGSRGSNNIGVALTLGEPVQITNEPIAIVPQFEMTSIVHHTFWQQYTYIYTPAQPYEYITIGNFRNDASTSIGTFTTGNGVAYYFLDNVAVSPVAPLPAEAVRLEQIPNEAAMELGWIQAEDAAGDQFVLERSMDQKSFVPVQDLGKADGSYREVVYQDRDALPGVQYYYRMRILTSNGELQYSPVIAATYGEAVDFIAGNVYPNPVRDRFNLDFTALVEGELQLQLFDGAGRMVMAENKEMGIGEPSPSYEMPQGAATGVYQARFSFEGQTFTQKVIVNGLN
jgi:hypothetical protein